MPKPSLVLELWAGMKNWPVMGRKYLLPCWVSLVSYPVPSQGNPKIWLCHVICDLPEMISGGGPEASPAERLI